MFALISGLLFGAGLTFSGMINPDNVIGFLNLTGDWNPSLMFVMGGALLVFIPGYHFLVKPRQTALNHEPIQLPVNKCIDEKLIVGAALFGVGWGLGGICPGPALVNLLGGSFGGMSFVISMLIGMWAALKWQEYSEERKTNETIL